MWRWIAALYAATLAAHHGYRWAAGDTAGREFFYVARGVEGALLFLSLALLAATRRAAAERWALFALAVYGAVEEALTAMCGIGWYWLTPPAAQAIAAGGDLCSRSRGWWWMSIVATAVILLAARMRDESAGH